MNFEKILHLLAFYKLYNSFCSICSALSIENMQNKSKILNIRFIIIIQLNKNLKISFNWL